MTVDDLGYEGVEHLIAELPTTWIPALTRKIVETGYKKGVWVDGGCSHFVAKVEERIGKEKA